MGTQEQIEELINQLEQYDDDQKITVISTFLVSESDVISVHHIMTKVELLEGFTDVNH